MKNFIIMVLIVMLTILPMVHISEYLDSLNLIYLNLYIYSIGFVLVIIYLKLFGWLFKH